MSDLPPEPLLVLEPPVFLHHLTGGPLLLLGSNRAATLLAPGRDGPILFSLPRKSSVLSLLKEQTPLRILGRTRYNSVAELNEPVSSNFALSALNAKSHSDINSKNHCLADGQFHLWSGIANTLSKDNRDAEAMLATRVRSQIHLSLMRLERLSLAYRTTLVYAAANQAPSLTICSSGAYSQHLGSEYRSCINELYSLRDAILAAAFRLRFGNTEPFQMRKIRSVVLAETRGVALLIAQSMFDQSGDMLIDRMSLYRSIALHCIGATNPVIGDVYQLRASTGVYGQIPYLVYPLYDDIAKMRAIEQGSSKGLFERVERSEVERFLGLPNHQDALEFCFDCFVRLLRICEQVAEEAGIASQMTAVTDDEILDIKFTDENGVFRQYRKDTETGKLVEY